MSLAPRLFPTALAVAVLSGLATGGCGLYRASSADQKSSGPSKVAATPATSSDATAAASPKLQSPAPAAPANVVAGGPAAAAKTTPAVTAVAPSPTPAPILEPTPAPKSGTLQGTYTSCVEGGAIVVPVDGTPPTASVCRGSSPMKGAQLTALGLNGESPSPVAFAADDNGNFSVALPPGTYTVSAVRPVPPNNADFFSPFRLPEPQSPVTVQADQTTVVTFVAVLQAP